MQKQRLGEYEEAVVSLRSKVRDAEGQAMRETVQDKVSPPSLSPPPPLLPPYYPQPALPTCSWQPQLCNCCFCNCSCDTAAVQPQLLNNQQLS